MNLKGIKFSKTTLRGQWLHMIQPIDEECFTAEGWCSQCGKHFTVDSGWIEDEFRYCPNCGAYMGDSDDKILRDL